MHIFIVNAGHPTISGNPSRPHFTKKGADAYAAELLNLILVDYTDDDDEIILSADATAETWSDKCLEYRQHVADAMGVDLDSLEDDDAGDVWIVAEELVGAPDFEGMSAQLEWLKAKLAHLQLPVTKRDLDTREKHFVMCGMPELRS